MGDCRAVITLQPSRVFVVMGGFLAGLLGPLTASGQSIKGRLVSSESGLPVSNALVILQDTLDHQIARTNTFTSGAFAFYSVGGETHRLKVLRIGYPPWQSQDIRLNRDEVFDVKIDLPVERIMLTDDIVIRGSGACSSDQESGAATALLMEEARKAFALAQETLTGPSMRFRTSTYLRKLNLDGVVLEESTVTDAPLHDWPIQSAPEDTLARWGFVRPASHLQRAAGLGPTYYGPDGAVLFSPWFLGSHCYQVTRHPGDTLLVGLGFRPASGHAQPGIEGILWIDHATLELDRLEYHYVDLPSWVPRASAGGQLEFSQLPVGGWVVSRWWIRAPIEERPVGPGATRLAGFQESGGSVVEVVDRRGGHVVWLDGRR